MTAKRKHHTAAFKAQVALAALKGDRIVNELAGQFEGHPTLIHAWKKQLLQGAEALFANGAKAAEADAEAVQAQLYEQIGRLKMELETTMWRMQDGDRVLTETEWALFSTGLGLLRDFIEEEILGETDGMDTGIPVFDRLTPQQKLTLLADTVHALCDPATPTPRHTAANEGAIAAVFAMVRVELEMELDNTGMEGTDEKATEIRRMIRAVCDVAEEREEPLPDETATEPDEWDWLLEEFECRIFWDTDFAMGDEFLDLPPDEAREKLQLCRIDPDYFLAVPDDPDKAGLTAARQTLARLLGLPVPGEDGLYAALEDLYHGLVIGSCSPEEIALWESNPWVEVIGMPEPGWDCDYLMWTATFSQALPTTPFQLAPGTTEATHETASRISLERRGKGWVVRDEDQSYWCGLVENGWTNTPDDEDMPALTFPTEAEARAAYAQAGRMYAEREKRHEQAMAQLGLADE